MSDSSARAPKILFLITEDWYFLSHRVALARACKAMGWNVVVATRVSKHADAIRAEGFGLIPIRMRRSDRHPVTETMTILELVRIFWREHPDIVHQVGMKPVIYGSVASMVAPRAAVINALAGMGYIFTSAKTKIAILRSVLRVVLRACIHRKNSWLIVQNDDDVRVAHEGELVVSGQLEKIRGSGVDLDVFKPRSEDRDDNKKVCIGVAARMLRDKGIREVIWAARMLHDAGVNVTFKLAGNPDPMNPSSLSQQELDNWGREGCVQFLGEVNDMATFWSDVDIAVLPSYREGLPKALIEAAAVGLPIITTDVPGCREVVDEGENGFLVPRGAWVELADAVRKLALDPDMRARFGAASRRKAEQEFGVEKVVDQTLALYGKAANLPLSGEGRA